MTTDFKTIYDHPAVLLSQEARQGDDVFADHFLTAASRLRGYEQRHGVTFAALDNDALAAVREAYNRSVTTNLDTAHLAMLDLRSAISDMLGLDDQ